MKLRVLLPTFASVPFVFSNVQVMCMRQHERRLNGERLCIEFAWLRDNKVGRYTDDTAWNPVLIANYGSELRCRHSHVGHDCTPG